MLACDAKRCKLEGARDEQHDGNPHEDCAPQYGSVANRVGAWVEEDDEKLGEEVARPRRGGAGDAREEAAKGVQADVEARLQTEEAAEDARRTTARTPARDGH